MTIVWKVRNAKLKNCGSQFLAIFDPPDTSMPPALCPSIIIPPTSCPPSEFHNLWTASKIWNIKSFSKLTKIIWIANKNWKKLKPDCSKVLNCWKKHLKVILFISEGAISSKMWFKLETPLNGQTPQPWMDTAQKQRIQDRKMKINSLQGQKHPKK